MPSGIPPRASREPREPSPSLRPDEGGAGRGGGILAILAFVGSAALAAAILRLAWAHPFVAAGGLAAIACLASARWLARRRNRRLLRSGDVAGVIARYQQALAEIPHPETMRPLMRATAFAAYGRVREAREALEAAERGPAWDAALEHRLFLDVLLLTFEGDRAGALERAKRIVRLPLPPGSDDLRGRISGLREAALALARAFAHEARPGDRSMLLRASEASPLVHWAMRYAAAVVAVDEGDAPAARALLGDAPPWPAESAFRAVHDELSIHADDAPAPTSDA